MYPFFPPNKLDEANFQLLNYSNMGYRKEFNIRCFEIIGIKNFHFLLSF